ncbi:MULTISPECIES: pyridoxal phosphate-dependent aminotransferase [unclassified Paenibacillus]|uniref:pyridoxal phosphate-dependent aminotransferase n=1 Tax=unclassified Paenibacillus TaxID=185978 RepID=UPI0004F620B6|nr:pyridoxal phosphate-dependent aminotransferase [Paenibacillus sp. FSL P4-0081]AIQ27325.1 aminotransferase [Paenibacillus sp. FSL P4-0081]
MNRFEPSQMLKSLPRQFFAALVARAGAVAAEGHDVINLGQGNPDMPTPAHIVESLQLAAVNPLNHKYPPFRGHVYLKEAVAEFYLREYGVELEPEREVAILFGGKTGLVEVVQCLLNPGDTALVPDPGYPDYWSGIELARAVMEMMPLTAERGFLPDYGSISPEAAAKAKLMFLNYPNNPTGAVATADFFRETVQFASDHNICVVHDFAYAAIGYEGQKPRSYLQTPGAKENGIEIYTLSKTYNMAGWRVAFAVGNASVIESLNLLQDHMYVSLFGAVQEAARTALLGPQAPVQANVARYEARRNVLIQGLRSIGWEVEAPRGSFFAWLPVPAGYTSQSFADLLLDEAHVVVAPGIGFGAYGEGYVRVGLVSEEARLAEAVERIAALKLFQPSGL